MSRPLRTTDENQPAVRDVSLPRANPNAVWICGHAEMGACCKNGPTPDGRCGRLASEVLNGESMAASDENAAACIPRRSSRWNRASTRTSLAIFTGGILLLCMALSSREQTFVPGELSSKHSQILENTLVAERCGLCHPNGQWTVPVNKSSLGLAIADGRQDELCINCHREQMPNAIHRNPHDVSATEWKALLKKRESTAMLLVSHSHMAESVDELSTTSCASCHVEHHGRGIDLKTMADDRCQACHKRQFESLASGHPEFKNFPEARPRALAFSHERHSQKHFPTKNREFDCQRCHVDANLPAALAPVSRSVSFEKACAECHNEPIKAATVEGWAVIQLPSIETATANSQSGLEHWPQAARFGFEGTISPLLRALLEADDAAANSVQQLPLSGRLSELPLESDRRQMVTMSIALATERLIVQTAARGQTEWRERLEKVSQSRLHRELNDADRNLIAAMCSGLPPDLFREMNRAWFQPSQPLASHIEITNTATPSLVLPSRNREIAPVERRSTGILVSEGPGLAIGGDQKNDDLLLDDKSLTGSSSDKDLLLGGPNVESNLESMEQPAARPGMPIKGATHLSGGGWFIDHVTLALRYMPTGHSDSTLAAWCLWWHKMEIAQLQPSSKLSWSPRAAGPNDASIAKSLPNQIPGGCAQCHTLTNVNTVSNSPEPIKVAWLKDAWRAEIRPLGRKEFTKFNHAPHLTLPAVKDCRFCHKMFDSVSKSNAHASDHASQVEFQAIEKSQCVACHRPGGANAGCLQCHNYHVTSELNSQSSVVR